MLYICARTYAHIDNNNLGDICIDNRFHSKGDIISSDCASIIRLVSLPKHLSSCPQCPPSLNSRMSWRSISRPKNSKMSNEFSTASRQCKFLWFCSTKVQEIVFVYISTEPWNFLPRFLHCRSNAILRLLLPSLLVLWSKLEHRVLFALASFRIRSSCPPPTRWLSNETRFTRESMRCSRRLRPPVSMSRACRKLGVSSIWFA